MPIVHDDTDPEDAAATVEDDSGSLSAEHTDDGGDGNGGDGDDTDAPMSGDDV